MKAFSKLNNVVFVAVLAFVVVAGSVSAFALPANQVHHSLNPIIVTGPCCQDITGETVTVTEPATVTPVVVEWSMEYVASGPFGLDSGSTPEYAETTDLRVFQKQLLPTEHRFIRQPFNG